MSPRFMRYEYLVGGLGLDWSPQDEQAQLNELGQQGWELVSVAVKEDSKSRVCTFFYFRRPIYENAPAIA